MLHRWDPILCEKSRDGTSIRAIIDAVIADIGQRECAPDLADAERQRLNEVRRLLYTVLGLQLNIQVHQRGAPPPGEPAAAIEDRAERIDMIERHCAQYAIPSLLRVMTRIPSVLRDRLTDPAYAIDGNPGRFELYHRLVELYAGDDARLFAVLEPLFKAENVAIGLDLVDRVVELRGGTFADLFHRIPNLAEQYAFHSFQRGDHGGVILAATGAGISNIVQRPLFAEKYLRTLLDEGEVQTAIDLINAIPVVESGHLQKSIEIGCVQIGWWYCTQEGRAAEGVRFLEHHVPHKLKSENTTSEVYRQLRSFLK